jgi:glycosyltransferase involved in cell wall biosynthesis
MAEKIIKLLTNPDLAEKMGKAGRENIFRLCQSKLRIEKITKILRIN